MVDFKRWDGPTQGTGEGKEKENYSGVVTKILNEKIFLLINFTKWKDPTQETKSTRTMENKRGSRRTINWITKVIVDISGCSPSTLSLKLFGKT